MGSVVRSIRIGQFVRVLIVLLLCISHARCISFGFLNYASLIFGNNVVAQASAEDISDSESELLAEGPIDLPVTIAKLESPDASKLDISESFGGSNLIKERALYQTSPRILIIEGLPEAVRNVEDQPIIVGFPYDQIENIVGDDVTVTVADDGSFTISIPTEGDALIASGNGDFVSPFLHITEDPVTGYFTIITTNTNPGVIDTDTQIAVDSDGYYYLNFNDSTNGGKSLVRRNVDGSSVQNIVTGSSISMEGLVVRTSNKAAYSHESSPGIGTLTLQLTSIVQSADEAISSNLVTNEVTPLFSEIVSFDYELAEIDEYDYSDNKIRFFFNDDEDGIILLNRNDPTVIFYNTTSTDQQNIIRTNLYDDIRIAFDIEANFLYAWILDEGLYSLFQTDMANDPSFAWGQREEILEFEEWEDVISMDASNGTLSYSVLNGTEVEWYVYTENGGAILVNDVESGNYENIKVSIDGTVVFACDTSGDVNQFVYFNVGEDTIRSVTGDPDVEVCSEVESSYYVADIFVHFFRDGQHAMININQLQ